MNDHEASLLEERLLNSSVPAVDLRYLETLHKLAATTVRRQANQHDCHLPSTGECGHPEHRRDVFYAAAMLEALDLPATEAPATAEDRREFILGLSSGGRRRPVTSFNVRDRRPSGT